jgi:acyl-CoA synthetase (AMP-forming)/AMP-acid ligase II
MLGLMQNRPLLISSLIAHAARNHADTEVISRLGDGKIIRTDYRKTELRSKKLAQALKRLEVSSSDRVGTLAWNTHRHLELYYGISGSGAICHTVNPRLFFEQIVFICNHAEDKVIFFDLSFVELAEKLAPLCPSIKTWIALCDSGELPKGVALPGLQSYEDLIAAQDGAYEWPLFDENTASSLCYTSGTTGDPKGVLYSHRSTILHSYAAAMPDCFNLSARDVVIPASSMYHANAWGVAYAATLVGAKLVLPGSRLDGASLIELIAAEAATVSFGVPTIWLGVAQSLEKTSAQIPSLKRLVIGGAACPLALMDTFRERHGVEVSHLWGMTETSPLGTVNVLKPKHDSLPVSEKNKLRSKQGRIVYGVELEIVNDAGKPLPHDGKAFGDLLVRGWWISNGYYKVDKAVLRDGGWFQTGDVATIDADGYMGITDRSKDVIKSGGEWISSIDLENAAVAHPNVAEAAVIGVHHPKWDERPLLIIVPKVAGGLSKGEILEFLRDKVAKWWLPDDVLFVDEIPHTATGKIQKMQLRARFADHLSTRQ